MLIASGHREPPIGSGTARACGVAVHGRIITAMSDAIAFDTHRFVKRLKEGGFTERQAETLADEQVSLLNANLATKADIADVKADIEKVKLATKADIEVLRLETKADIEALRLATKADIEAVKGDIEALRLETKADIEAIKADLIRWMVGMMVAMTGIFAAIVKLL